MAVIPDISPQVLANARDVWNQTINQYGRDIVLSSVDGTFTKTVKGFAKRPKIMGLFDRTQASYDQEKYQLILRADDFPDGMTPEKFMRATWDGEDHNFISVTAVDLKGVIFGYRVLVKG
jgi:hypothetical protein